MKEETKGVRGGVAFVVELRLVKALYFELALQGSTSRFVLLTPLRCWVPFESRRIRLH